VKVKQRWSVMRWVTKNLLSRALLWFERHVKLLVPAAIVVVSTHQSVLGPRGGLWPILLISVIHKEGPCPSSGGINRHQPINVNVNCSGRRPVLNGKKNDFYFITRRSLSLLIKNAFLINLERDFTTFCD
jgi:hypothetical protein